MRRRGVTLIEMMVVVGVIGVAMALILPAVQEARENARRSDCTKNLMQIGLALHNYHAVHGVFPPGRIRSHWDGEGRQFSALAQILPYLEQTPIYNAINFDLNPDVNARDAPQAENTTAAGATVSGFLCPSDTTALAPGRGGPNSYVLNSGKAYAISRAVPRRDWPDGVFYENSSIKLADITDGYSNTAIVSETTRSGPDGPTTWDGLALLSTASSSTVATTTGRTARSLTKPGDRLLRVGPSD